MKKILSKVLYLALAIPIFANATSCPTDNVVIDPPVFDWTYHQVTANNEEAYYSGTLEFGEATFDINGDSITTRAYRQAGSSYSIPGPTLNMKPGNKYVLRFNNLLPFEPLSEVHNDFKDPNASNLHTHGLHISGETPSDDVTRFFEGGFGGDFVYDIPPDHMGGTYWYHAHHHGSTFLQVSGGAFGLILIDDSEDVIPLNVAEMSEKQLVIAFLDSAVAGTGGDTLVSGTLSPTWTVNGDNAGNICMPTNTWQHWRILIADRDARTKTLEVGAQCELALMARDGVWRNQAPKLIEGNTLRLTGASRADVAIRCSDDSEISIDGDLAANIYADGASDETVHPYAADGVSTWSAKRPGYLKDLRTHAPVHSERVGMGARSINGNKFDVDVPTFSLPVGDVQEWRVKGATNHPFHLHVYHVQPTETCGDFEGGEYYDVIASGCTVRFSLDPALSTVYAGRTILHCHILAHEDQGAMGWADVVGGLAPPTFPTDGDVGITYQDYYSLGGPGGEVPAAPTSLVATANSNQISLSWVDNAINETGYQLERSTDGVNFNLLATAVINTTSYLDLGLAANTTYYYRVLARNTEGNSPYSNIASATTENSGQPASVQVGSINVSTVSQGKGYKKGRAVIEVIDDLGNPLANAVVVVSGEYRGDIIEDVTADIATDNDGVATIDSDTSAKGVKTLTFCVTEITHAVLLDFSAAPGSVCGSL